MLRRLKHVLVVWVLLFPALALAVQPDEILADKKLELRARDLSVELRCLVCQNQSIDDSDAPLARDLRILVRERLKAGDSDTQIKAYLFARYGEFIFLKPPLSYRTLLLWIFPALILLGAVLFLIVNFRRRRERAIEPLNDSELAALRNIFDEK